MRIVNVEDFFMPDAGYQINILSKYLAKFGHEVYIITASVEGFKDSVSSFFGTENMKERDEEYTRKTGVKIIRVKPLVKRFVSGRIIFGPSLFKTIKDLKPDVLFAHGNDTVSGICAIRKKLPFAVITDSHMLKMASTNKFSKYFQTGYRKFVTPKIIKKDITVIRTQDDNYVEEYLGIPLSRAPWISYGSDLDLFCPDVDKKRAFRLKNNIPEDNFVFVYTGKMDAAKGGKLLAEAFLKKFDTHKNVTLITVGNLNGEYGEEVKATFDKSENQIVQFPTQKYTDLAKFYQAADACVFARQCSLSFYDAQGCALPVISENNNINVDRNSHNNGLCFEAESLESFRETIEKILNMSCEEYEAMGKNARDFISRHYNYETKAREYEKAIIDAYQKFIGK